ncbi:ohanin-like [Elgaria multicarinata webbii]|uniref:ohanin-like n=1 Tax=Elgaria multicarinata webbii TaxID=159646 RepID=UPI002FCD049C
MPGLKRASTIANHQQQFAPKNVYKNKEEFPVAMPPSTASHPSSLHFLQTSNVLQKFKGLCFILWLFLCFLDEREIGGKVLASSPHKAYTTDVTFDPKTAHPDLAVSQNKKKVESIPRPEHVPDNPERFNSTPCLLGSPGFTSGKHYWEVVYGVQREWAAGVARESVRRKGNILLVPEQGIWQRGLWWLRQMETDSRRPGKMGVFLDYDQDSMIFYLENKVIKVRTSFNGERVFPFFYVGSTVSLSLNP